MAPERGEDCRRNQHQPDPDQRAALQRRQLQCQCPVPLRRHQQRSAVVLVICPSLYLADDFSAAPLLQGSQMVGSANNLLATEETGEPNHDGKNGQHSVWMAWQPQGTGIATFFTLGSAFDTTLAVYTNIAPSSPAYVSQLAPVAADDDSGPISPAPCNSMPCPVKPIISRGRLWTGGGNIVLSWSLLTTKKTLPVIVQQPLSCVAGFGDTSLSLSRPMTARMAPTI